MPPMNIAIVENPLAGVGRAVTMARRLSDSLKDRNIPHQLFEENWPADFDGFSDVWIVGGDGTLNFFVNKYPQQKLPMVVWNGGTGNDFHWLLYGKLTYEEQMEIALSASPKPYDIGRCNEKYFLNGIGIGFEGAVAQSVHGKKKLPGKTSFLIAVLKKIFAYSSSSYRLTSAETGLKEGRNLLISIMNGRRAGGGFHIAPASAADDGLLDVVAVDQLHPFLRLRYLPVIEKGKHLHLPFVHHFTTKKIRIESGSVILAHADGEPFSADTLEIEVLPGQYSFRVK